MKNSASTRIKGPNLEKLTDFSKKLKILDLPLANFSIKLPGNYKISKSFSEVSVIDIKQQDQYRINDRECFPLPELDIVFFSWDLKSPEMDKSGRNDIRLTISIVHVEEFSSVFFPDRFEGAVDRYIYNRWGPGGGHYWGYESGLNWKYQYVNKVDWLSYESAMVDVTGLPQHNMCFNKTFCTPIGDDHFIQLHLELNAACDNSFFKDVLVLAEQFQGIIINNFELLLSDDQQLNRDLIKERCQRSQENLQRKPIKWQEKALQSMGDIRSILGKENGSNVTANENEVLYTGHAPENVLVEDLVFCPYDDKDKISKIKIPLPKEPDDPAVKAMLLQLEVLVDEMKRTLASHKNFK